MGLDAIDGIKLIEKCMRNHIEDKIYQRWLVDYSKMSEDNFTSFSDYIKKLIPQRAERDDMTNEDVVNKALEIERKLKGGE